MCVFSYTLTVCILIVSKVIDPSTHLPLFSSLPPFYLSPLSLLSPFFFFLSSSSFSSLFSLLLFFSFKQWGASRFHSISASPPMVEDCKSRPSTTTSRHCPSPYTLRRGRLVKSWSRGPRSLLSCVLKRKIRKKKNFDRWLRKLVWQELVFKTRNKWQLRG